MLIKKYLSRFFSEGRNYGNVKVSKIIERATKEPVFFLYFLNRNELITCYKPILKPGQNAIHI
jgi:hypothetical protein